MSDRDRLIANVQQRGLWRGIAEALALLTPAERMRSIGLVVSMNFNALLGLVGLAGVLPFVQLLLAEKPLEGDGILARTMRFLGFGDVTTALFFVGTGLVLLILAKNLYALFHTGFQNRFCAGAEARFATHLLQRVTAAPYAWLATRNSAVIRDIVVGQAIEWSRGVIRPTLQAANDILFLILVFGLLIYASPVAGLVVSVSAGALAGALMLLSRPRIAFHAERKRRAIRLAGVTASEAIAGGRDVRISGAGSMMVASFASDMGDYSRQDAVGRQWQQVPRLGIEVIGFAALIGIALVALAAGTPRAEVAGLLALYAVVAVRAIPMISQLVLGMTAITGALPAVAEIKALMEDLPPAHASEAVEPVTGWSRLEMKGVSFVYDKADAPAVGPLDLEIAHGKSVGIVGASGAGKSTLVDLVVGLLPAQTGQVLLDGRPLDGALQVRWRASVAYVAQAPFLIDASLRDNVVFGASREAGNGGRIADAISAAGLDDVVAGLPQGLDTPLGERGARLSGGQKQRVAIARALYRNADLIIMDEATSSLDSLTEREVIEELDRLKGRVTLIVVAHRLSTVIRLDEIVLLDKGQIVATGSHNQLLARSPAYRGLVEAQALPGLVEEGLEA